MSFEFLKWQSSFSDQPDSQSPEGVPYDAFYIVITSNVLLHDKDKMKFSFALSQCY